MPEFQPQNRSDVGMITQGVGDLPNEDLQAFGCPLLSRPCRGDPCEHSLTEVVVGDPYIDLGAESLGRKVVKG